MAVFSIRRFAIKQLMKTGDDGIMKMPSDMKADFAEAMLTKQLIDAGIDPRLIKNEQQLVNVLDGIDDMKKKMAEMATKESKKVTSNVVDMKGKKLDSSKPIMGGTQESAALKSGIMRATGAKPMSVKTKNRPDVYDLDDYDTTNMSDIKKEIIRTETKLGNLNPESKGFRKAAKELGDKIIALKNKLRDDKAMGGRIGYAMGSKGIMQMASAPDIMDERNEMSLRMFNKPIDVLTPEEMDILEEEIMRLMEKFSKVDRGAPSITLADGGRIGYKDGPKDPRRRTFMKIAGGLASMIPGLGMLGKGVKVAAPVVTKAAEITGPALAKIVDTVMSFGKLVSLKGKRVKEMVTKKKHQGVEVTEDIQDGSYIIKKGDKEIYYKPGRQDETGGFEDDIIEVIGDRIKKAGGGIGYMLGE